MRIAWSWRRSMPGSIGFRSSPARPTSRKARRSPWRWPGRRLIDGHADGQVYRTLKPSAIRGIRSEGMVCSEKELGLSDEHEGIMVLEAEAPKGAPLAEWLGETVIEFEITPNLVHDFSILGIAREAGALTNRQVAMPSIYDLASAPSGPADLVTVEAPDLCARYVAVVIEGIAVEPSPAWLQRRLLAAGVRPINSIVDATNYVMLEYGQPLHAFDADRLADGRIVVRRRATGETTGNPRSSGAAARRGDARHRRLRTVPSVSPGSWVGSTAR